MSPLLGFCIFFTIFHECTSWKLSTFAEVWVSTDHDGIALEAEAAGANVHWRSPETASDNASTISVVQDFIQSHSDPSSVAVVQCTSPFICPIWLKEAVTQIQRISDVDCVFSVTRTYKLRWTSGKDGKIVAANFNRMKRPRRQDWDGELHENGMLYIAKKSLIMSGALQNDRCRVTEVSSRRSLEIDDEFDLELARAMAPLLSPCPKIKSLKYQGKKPKLVN